MPRFDADEYLSSSEQEMLTASHRRVLNTLLDSRRPLRANQIAAIAGFKRAPSEAINDLLVVHELIDETTLNSEIYQINAEGISYLSRFEMLQSGRQSAAPNALSAARRRGPHRRLMWQLAFAFVFGSFIAVWLLIRSTTPSPTP